MRNEIGSQIYGTRYWIGMRDNNDTMEGLIWDHNNAPAIFNGLENIIADITNDVERCCMLYQHQIRDWSCNTPLRYICLKVEG